MLTNANNYYSGGTTVSNGTLEATTPTSLPMSGGGYYSVSVAAGATLATAVGGSADWHTADIATLLASTAFSQGAALGIDTTDGDFPYDDSISGNMGLTKLGSNTLTLSSSYNYTYTGQTIAADGTLDLESSVSGPIVVTDGRVIGPYAPLPLDTTENSACNNAAPSPLTDGSLVLPFAPLGLNYISGSVNPHPIIAVDAELQQSNGAGTLTSVDTNLTFTGFSGGGTSETYSIDDFEPDTLYRFATQDLTDNFATTGRYAWTMTITENYSDNSSITSTYSGYKDILNWNSSPFGAGWQLESLDYLVPDANPSGVSLVEGDGTMAFFASNGQGGYTSESGPLAYSTLASNPSTGGWTLTGTDGVMESFNTSGQLVSTTDQDGNQTTYNYSYNYTYNGTNSSDNLLITDPAGRTTVFVGYSVGYSGGQVSAVVDFAGRATTLSYTTIGQLQQLTSIEQPDPSPGNDPGQPTTQFGYYTATGLMETSTDADNNITTYTYYDPNGTLWAVTNPDEPPETYQCMQAAALVVGTSTNPASLVNVSDVNATYTDELSNTTTYTFDRFGNTTSVINALNNTTTYFRNDNGQVTEETLPGTNDGSVPTTYSYDSDGNLLSETLPDGSMESWTYTTITTYGGKLDAVDTYTDPLSHETIYTYATTPYQGASSATGDLLEIDQVHVNSSSQRDDVLTYYTYTQLGVAQPSNSVIAPAGLVLTEVDPLGYETNYQYDPHGLVNEVTYAVGITGEEASVYYTYDSTYETLLSSTNELGYETDYAYDNLDRLLSVTGPAPDPINHPNDRPETTYLYDALGNVTQVSVEQSPAVWETTTYTYNYLGEVLTKTEPAPNNGSGTVTTTYAYTPTGQVYTIINALGGTTPTTTYGYDAIGEVTSVTQNDLNGNASTTSYTYDEIGRLEYSETPNGAPTSYTYTYSTSIHTLSVETTLPTYNTTTDVYDADGELVSAINAMGNTTTYSYDDLGNPQPVTYNNTILGPVYDKDGNVTSDTDLVGNSTSYTYNHLGEVLTKTAPSPTGSGTVTTHYFYDLAGELTSVVDPVGNTTTYVYDALGRVTSVTTGQGGSTLTTSSTYDLAGDLLTSTDSGGNTTTYTYDTRGNMLSETDPERQNHHLHLRRAGRRPQGGRPVRQHDRVHL